MLGTCAGIVVGSLLANAVGPSTWSIAIIIPAITFGVYFQRVSYALMTAGITVMVSMLYVDLGEFSNGLLLDRLELTAIGSAIAMIAALVIFPVRTRRVVRQAALAYLDALLAFFEGLSETVKDASNSSQPVTTLSSTVAARHLDDTLQQLLVTARPVARDPFRRDELGHNLQLFVVSAHFARNLAADTGAVSALNEAERDQLATALETGADLVRSLHGAIATDSDPVPDMVNPAVGPLSEAGRSLAEHGVTRGDPRRRFLRALFNLDGVLVQLGQQLADA